MVLGTFILMVPALLFSVPYMLMMETVFKYGVRPGSRQSLWLSTVLGALAGGFLWYVLSGITTVDVSPRDPMRSLPLLIVGAFVGLVTGALVFMNSKREREKMPPTK